MIEELIKQWWDNPRGWCYAASEAYYYLMGGKEAGLKPMQAKVGPPLAPCYISHWWLEDKDGKIIDLTVDQFDFPFPYEIGTGRGFQTNMKADTREIIEFVNENRRTK